MSDRCSSAVNPGPPRPTRDGRGPVASGAQSAVLAAVATGRGPYVQQQVGFAPLNRKDRG